MKNKIFTRIIITTLLVTFLTFNVGRVTRVSAVATTTAAVIAFDCLVALGAIGITYSCLSNAEVNIPLFADTAARDEYLHDCGEKLVQYPAAYDAYQELYRYGLDEPLHNVLDDVWTWTSDKLKSWANDFSSTDTLQNIYSYSYTTDISGEGTNGFDYPSLGTYIAVPNMLETSSGVFRPISEVNNVTMSNGYHVTISNGTYYNNIVSDIDLDTYTLRNYLRSDGKYKVQRLVNGTWSDFTTNYDCGDWDVGYEIDHLVPYSNGSRGYTAGRTYHLSIPAVETFPILTDTYIYDSVNDRVLPMVIPQSDHYQVSPSWNNNDNEPKLPVIPYVKLPWNPNWVNPSGGPSGGGNWGFNLDDLLDKLLDLSGLLCEIGSIAELINQFKNSLTGSDDDAYYIYYDDSNNSYYEYYSITNYGDETYYIYDIDVSDTDEHLSVDLNTIQTYSNNRYLTQIKESAIAGSSMIRDLAVFWYDVDPEVTYIVLGCCILVLIGAFTGKLGHS